MLRAVFVLVIVSTALPAVASTSVKTPAKPVVTVLTATRAEISDPLTYPARVESDVNARVLAETDGVVLKILSPLGSKIRRGSGLAVLKNVESGYRYAPMTIFAAIGGVVSQVKVTVGSQVARGQELFIVTDPEKLKLTVEVSAPDIEALRSVQRGEFTAAGLAEAVPVRLVGISPLIDPATGTATAELRALPRKGGIAPLAPGQLGQARFDISLREGFLLPDHAILYKGEETLTRLVIDGKAKKVPVKLGRKRGDRVEILAGLKAGDTVIERASGYVGDGAEVDVQGKGSGATGAN